MCQLKWGKLEHMAMPNEVSISDTQMGYPGTVILFLFFSSQAPVQAPKNVLV